jgi:hypothetical protein
MHHAVLLCRVVLCRNVPVAFGVAPDERVPAILKVTLTLISCIPNKLNNYNNRNNLND